MKQRVLKITLFVILCLAGAATVLPFLWMLLSSFKTNAEIEALEQSFLPRHPTLENYINLQNNFDFLRYFANSILIALVVTILVIYTSCICGYVLGKYKFKGKNLIFRSGNDDHDGSLVCHHYPQIHHVCESRAAGQLSLAYPAFHVQRIWYFHDETEHGKCPQ